MQQKELELNIMLSAPNAQIAAIKSVLTEEQLASYNEKMTEIKNKYIEKNNISDPDLLKLIEERYK